MNRIIIEKVSEDNAFTKLKSEWQTLFGAANCAPFLSWEWISVWHKYFGANKKPFILTARRDDRLIGILPLYHRRQQIFGIRLRQQLGFLGDSHGGADYLDLIAETAHKSEVLAAMFDFLQTENFFDSIRLENLAGDAEIVEFLQTSDFTTTQSFHSARHDGEVCPQICLEKGWEAVLKQSKRAGSFAKILKKLHKIPGFEFRSVDEPNEIGAAIERFYHLHEKRWAAEGGSELSGNPQLLSFQRELVSILATAKLIRFNELWIAGECRATNYCLEHGDTFYYYNGGYDLDWAKLSVGFIAVGLSIKDAAERGFAVYDFLRGDEKYKFEWATGTRQLVSINLSRSSAAGFAYQKTNAAWRKILTTAKSALPRKMHENLRNFRRNFKRSLQILICGGQLFLEELTFSMLSFAENNPAVSHLAEVGIIL
jgi:CelD/BcsL family acetyltransferase involved in cellulose biosynthesis